MASASRFGPTTPRVKTPSVKTPRPKSLVPTPTIGVKAPKPKAAPTSRSKKTKKTGLPSPGRRSL